MGARVDRVSDARIRHDLLIARRGQAFFSRQLRTLRDSELSGRSRVAGWTRAHVVAYAGLSARAITRLTEWALEGSGSELWSDRTTRDAEIDFSATLPAEALRSLSEHAAVHLDVEWRDLSDRAWETSVGEGSIGPMALSATPMFRARQVWLGALALDAGASAADIPAEILRVLAPVGEPLVVPATPASWP